MPWDAKAHFPARGACLSQDVTWSTGTIREPKWDDNRLGQVESQTTEVRKLFIDVECLSHVTRSIGENHTHIVNKGTDGRGAWEGWLKFPEWAIHNENKEQWRKWASLSDTTTHLDASIHASRNLNPASAVMAECLDGSDDRVRQPQAPEHIKMILF